MRTTLCLAIVCATGLFALNLLGEEQKESKTKESDIRDTLMRGDSDAIGKLSDNLRRERQQMIAALVSVLEKSSDKPLDGLLDYPGVVAAQLLGEMRAEEAVNALVERVSVVSNMTTDLRSPETVHPCSAALIRIGKPASLECLKRLAAERVKDGKENLYTKGSLMLEVIRHVEGDDVARFMLQNAIDKERDKDKKANLTAALALLDKRIKEEAEKSKPPAPEKDAKPGGEAAPLASDKAADRNVSTPNMPRWLRPIEAGLPDDAIVALVDFKAENIKGDESKMTAEAKCIGTVNRFITGSDNDKKIEFDCVIGGESRSILVKPDTWLEYAPGIEDLFRFGQAKNCLLVYQRNKDGTAKILRFNSNGLGLAPAYEWLESTKNRKDDRVPLAVMVLMDKTVPPEVRYLAYRTVAFSTLAFKSRFEIMKKAAEVAANRDDTMYGAGMLACLAFTKELTKDENVEVIRYFLQGLAVSKDVGDANKWLGLLSQDVQVMNPQDYSDLCTEIADVVKKHEVEPAPGQFTELVTYDKVKKFILQRVQPKQSAPAPGEKPAPPAEGGAESAAPEKLGQQVAENVYSGKYSPRPLPPLMPPYLQPEVPQVGPGPIIVALADFKFENVTKDEAVGDIKAKCIGTVSRFLASTDKVKKLEFEWRLQISRKFLTQEKEGGFIWSMSLPGDERDNPLVAAVRSGEAKNCLVTYQREKDGSVVILDFELNGLDLAPVADWLENTSDRLLDRVPLAVMVLMDKTAARELRELAYRMVVYSNLAVKSQVEIIRKAIEVGANKVDTIYGVHVLAALPAVEEVNKDEKAVIIHYFLECLASAKDLRQAATWVLGLAGVTDYINPKENPELCKEIADAVERHEVQPVPDDPQAMTEYKRLQKMVLDNVKPKPPVPSDKPAPPADGGTKPPAPDKDAKPSGEATPPASDKAADKNVVPPRSIIPKWEKGDWWEVQVYSRWDQTQQSGDPRINEEMKRQGFFREITCKFEVINVAADGVIETDVTYGSSGVGNRRITFSKDGVFTKAMKLDIKKATGERTISELEKEPQNLPPTIIMSKLSYPDVGKVREVEQNALTNKMELLRIVTDNEFLWERGLPWWRKQFFSDDHGIRIKAYLIKCHYRGQDTTFPLPSDISKTDEDIAQNDGPGVPTKPETKPAPNKPAPPAENKTAPVAPEKDAKPGGGGEATPPASDKAAKP